MEKTKKLVLFGEGAFAEIAYEYFTHDSAYEVVAFTIDRAYIKRDTLFGLPIVPFEEVTTHYPPDQYEMHIALVYNHLNRLRTRIYQTAKSLGYTLANYVSSRSFVWHNVPMGDNVFVFEDNTIQPFVKLGSNIVLWSGNHIGHHSTIESHNFISSHVVISGFCHIGESCFFGVNSTVGNNVTVGKDAYVGAGALIVKDIPAGAFIRQPANAVEEKSTYQKFGIQPD